MAHCTQLSHGWVGDTMFVGIKGKTAKCPPNSIFGNGDTHLELKGTDLVDYRYLQSFVVHKTLALLKSCHDEIQCTTIPLT